MPSITIGKHTIGPGHPPFVVAEMSGNHNGSLDRALSIVDAVAASGAHALKIQTYTPDTITIDDDSPRFRISDGHALWAGETLYSLYRTAHTPYDWHEAIFDRARSHGLIAFSAPFDPTAVELLESLDVPAYKIASSEIVDLPLIRLVAATGKPVIISTGMASLPEIHAAVDAARRAGAEQLMLLACTASYPAPPEDSNLRRIPLLSELFGVPVGLSDHTIGVGVPLAAVGLGASLIEKHVTLSRTEGGVDAAFSADPTELALLVADSERGWRGLGTSNIGPTEAERDGLRFRRSLCVVENVRAGDRVTAENVRSIRPAGGLAPELIDLVLGRTFRIDATRGTALTWDLI